MGTKPTEGFKLKNVSKKIKEIEIMVSKIWIKR
jgi:hypothetical protein